MRTLRDLPRALLRGRSLLLLPGKTECNTGDRFVFIAMKVAGRLLCCCCFWWRRQAGAHVARPPAATTDGASASLGGQDTQPTSDADWRAPLPPPPSLPPPPPLSRPRTQRLFRYISGANAAGTKIDMTAPVRSLMVPSDGPFCETKFDISFFVPFALQPDPPTPTSPDVFIQPADPASFYVLSYGGFTSEEKVVAAADSLVQALDAAGVPSGSSGGGEGGGGGYDASRFYAAGYDAPFRLIGRHNEVWIQAT